MTLCDTQWDTPKHLCVVICILRDTPSNGNNGDSRTRRLWGSRQRVYIRAKECEVCRDLVNTCQRSESTSAISRRGCPCACAAASSTRAVANGIGAKRSEFPCASSAMAPLLQTRRGRRCWRATPASAAHDNRPSGNLKRPGAVCSLYVVCVY